jgi:site-specific DNA-methyltransferase (adenine-specific)
MVTKKPSRGERERLLTVGEAASTLEVTPATLRNWDRSGKLKAHRHPINQYRLYRAADVLALKNKIKGNRT